MPVILGSNFKEMWGYFLFDNLQLTLMTLLPKNYVSRLVGRFAGSRLSRRLIPYFARHFGINVEESEFAVKTYGSLTEFFIRKLKPGLRPVAQGDSVVVSPVDGVVSEFGPIKQGVLIQAKGVDYTVLELLGQDKERAQRFANGLFLTIYLSPRDYHRIHVPVAGQVVASTYVPGTLFPVNPFGVRAVKGLFALNERLITYLQGSAGLLALVKVGATIVGSVKVNYASLTTNVPRAKLLTSDYPNGPSYFSGEEVGRFEFGSTVILLFEPGKVALTLQTGDRVLMGQKIGQLLTKEGNPPKAVEV